MDDTAFPPDPTGMLVRGYVQHFRVNTDLPEPTARLYQIKPGDTAERLAVQELSAAVRDGQDLRIPSELNMGMVTPITATRPRMLSKRTASRPAKRHPVTRPGREGRRPVSALRKPRQRRRDVPARS